MTRALVPILAALALALAGAGCGMTSPYAGIEQVCRDARHAQAHGAPGVELPRACRTTR